MPQPSTTTSRKKANRKKAKAKTKAAPVGADLPDGEKISKQEEDGSSSTTLVCTNDDADGDVVTNDTTDDLPTINHELLVLQNEGLTIARHPQLGRIVVACKNFDVESNTPLYTRILCEEPALVSTVGDHLEYLEQFLSASEQIQLGILDMYHQPLDSPMCQSLYESAQVLYMLGVLDDLALIHRLLSISATNAYQFQEGRLSALFLFGSKLSHSCHPNVAYTSARGKLEFRLIQPHIAAGAEVASSYLSDLYETPTFLRQKELMETKDFLCQCQRCCRPDDCRVAICPHCQTPIAPIPLSNSTTETSDLNAVLNGYTWQWICTECDNLDVSDVIRSKETAIAKLLKGLESLVNNAIEQEDSAPGGLAPASLPCTPEQIQDIINHCSSQLSSIHYLTLQGYLLLTTVATIQAHQYMQNNMICRPITGNDGNVGSDTDGGFVDNQKKMIASFQMSVKAGLQHVLCTECVAVQCHGGRTCHHRDSHVESPSLLFFPHAPLFGRGATMMHLAEDLQQHIPRSEWPEQAAPMLQRYLPILQAKYGDVGIVREIGRLLRQSSHQQQRRYQ